MFDDIREILAGNQSVPFEVKLDTANIAKVVGIVLGAALILVLTIKFVK